MKTKSTLLALLLLVGIANSYITNAQVNVNDSLALVDLYNSTNGPLWNNHNNWLTTSVKEWYGITVYDSRVTRIVLYNNSLKGPVPESIGNLTQLNRLDLGSNSITGKIPSSIGNLTHINELFLANNQLSDSIPSEIGNLVNCTTLTMTHNLLTGNLPASMGNLKKLSYFQLMSNQLSGSIPESFKHLTKMVNMSLSYNNLSGNVPTDFTKSMKDLSVIDLSYNMLTYKHNVKPTSPSYNHPFIIKDNNFTFDGLEFLAQVLQGYVQYSPQATIPIHKFNKTLRVYAGGTLANNTYKWFRKGTAGSVAVITGDSAFKPAQSGMYYAKIINSVVTGLTLKTDTVKYKVDEEGLSSVSVYPNPVKNTLIIKGLDANNRNRITVTDISGNILVAGIADKQSTANYDVSRLKPGNYVLNVTNGEEIKTLHFLKE